MKQATEYLVATHMKEAMPREGLWAEGYSASRSMVRDYQTVIDENANECLVLHQRS